MIKVFDNEAREIKEGQLFKAVIITDRELDCVELVPVDEVIKRETVKCDDNCGALENPETLEEYKETLKHERRHSYLSGCSHGC